MGIAGQVPKKRRLKNIASIVGAATKRLLELFL